MYDLFIDIDGVKCFDNLRNFIYISTTNECHIVWGEEEVQPFNLNGEIWYRHEEWGLPDRILIPTLTNWKLPPGTIFVSKKHTTRQDCPVLRIDSGRVIARYKSISDLLVKHPEFSYKAIFNTCQKIQDKAYGYYWAWDSMLPVREELLRYFASTKWARIMSTL